MKIFKIYFLAVCVISICISAKRAPTPQTYAIIVGVSNFQKSGITPLKYAHADAFEYYRFLRSPLGGGVPESNISYLPNEKATRSSVIGQLRYFSNLAGPNDVLIMYISTHGIPDPKIRDALYYTLYDTDPNNFYGTALDKDDIIRHQRISVAKIKLLFSDACHSGGSGISLGTKDEGNDLINRLQATQGALKEPSYSILAASSAAERSYEDVKWGGGHGVFTYYMLKGLSGEADRKGKHSKGNGNGIVTLRELYDYLNNTVPLETGKLQYPEMQSSNPDVIPISATKSGNYARALDRTPRFESTLSTLEPSNASIPISNPVTSGFGPEEVFVTMPEYEAFTKLNNSYFNCLGKAVFLNLLGEGVIMYRGVCTSQSVGESRSVLNIGNNRKGSTDALMIGLKEGRDGIPNVAVSSFKFYFATSDSAKPRRFGTISLPIKVGFQTQVALDKENLILTTTGERDQSYARYAGLQ